MEVIHSRCAGLDVHKDTVVACARRAKGREVKRRPGAFPDDDERPLAAGQLAPRRGLHSCGDGGDRGVLEASCR